jgi:porphobilinogen synthase
MQFPDYRPRRLRKNELFRRLVRETYITVDDLVAPLFICPGKGTRRPVPSMPGVFQLSIDLAIKEVEALRDLGICAVLLFGIPETKDPEATQAFAEKGIIQRAIREIQI